MQAFTYGGQSTKLKCPDCNSPVVNCVGKLPDVSYFAGRETSVPVAGGVLMHCEMCHLRFRSSVITDAQVDQMYKNSSVDSWSYSAISRNDWGEIRNIITAENKMGCTVLDVGCYTGQFLHSLGESYDRAGVEPNQTAAVLASEACHGPVWNSLESIPLKQRFDVIVSTDVIEHVKSPRAFLAKLRNLVNPNGLVIISTGNAGAMIPRLFGTNWWYCFYPEHISFISLPWLQCCEQLLDLQIVNVTPFSYQERHGVVWLTDAVQTVIYGLTGTNYIQFIRYVNHYRGHHYSPFPKGMGISSDHFIVTLKPTSAGSPL